MSTSSGPWSMTGYGEATAGRLHCALRSVNSRFLECRFRLPPALRPLEAGLEAEVRKSLPRGKVEVSFNFAGGAPEIDPAEIKARLEPWQFTGLINAPLSLSDLVRLMAQDEPAAADAALAAEGAAALGAALAALRVCQQQEGSALVAAVRGLLAALERELTGIEKEAEAAPAALSAALRERLARLDPAAPVEPQRLAQEIALLADRADISEEITRLKAHFMAVESLLGQVEIGKKLDFFTQEMGREVNTVGSKSRSVRITHSVIEMKALLEKIREQAANLG